MSTQQLWFTRPYTVEAREQQLPPLKPDEILVQSLFSAISAGTEMLVYQGHMPGDMALDTTLPGLGDKNAAYPLRYGYATVGRVIAAGDDVDEAWLGKKVFAFQPHATHFISTPAKVLSLPGDIRPASGVFLANMETAVNLIHDGAPLLGEEVVVLGLGIVGLLVSGLLARVPLAGLYAIDSIEKRRAVAESFGASLTCHPAHVAEVTAFSQKSHGESAHTGVDLIYELTGAPEAMNMAIDLCGFSGRIVVGSWYGTRSAALQLGKGFHRNRIRIISSQVSSIAPELSGRWDKRRRLEVAWEMIRKLQPEHLISHRIPFTEAAAAYQLLDRTPEQALQVVLTYPD